MIISLDEIGLEGQSIDRMFPADQFVSEDSAGSPVGGFIFRDDVHLRLIIGRNGSRFHLRGNLEAGLELKCCRCLIPVSFTVQPTFDYYLVPREAVEEWAEIEIRETAKTEVEVDSLELDLSRLIIEQVMLNVPMKLLCREDCRGICPTCGVELNDSACDCRDNMIDPRLEGFAEILDQLNDSKGKA